MHLFRAFPVVAANYTRNNTFVFLNQITMKKPLIIFLIVAISATFLSLLAFAGDKSCCDENAGRCTGSEYCSACTNCSRCAHCGAGGVCGVCSPGSFKKKKKVEKKEAQKKPGYVCKWCKYSIDTKLKFEYCPNCYKNEKGAMNTK